MTFFNIILHGVPDGQKVWSSDPLKQKGYIDAFYQPEPGAPETLFQVEVRVEGNTRVCYYHYLKYRDIQAKDGRGDLILVSRSRQMRCVLIFPCSFITWTKCSIPRS